LWAYQAKGRGINLQTDVERDLPAVRFDEAQLKQIFLNLLNNAFDAVDNSDKKCVTVRAGLNHGIVSITVIDSGFGFSNPERVFGPFFTTKGVGKGPGLGLSVCYGIVKQHGGEIRAFNVEPHGAGVTIELSAAQQELALTASGN
jgi:two-component system, NtrC family, sensor kinase